jgi:hypothetical protein
MNEIEFTIFHPIRESFTDEGLQKSGLCSALRAFEQEGIFMMSHLLLHGDSASWSNPKYRPHLVASYDTQWDAEDLVLQRITIRTHGDFHGLLEYLITKNYNSQHLFNFNIRIRAIFKSF